MFGVQLYKNNARALLSHILSIPNLDWLQHAHSVCRVYESAIISSWQSHYHYLVVTGVVWHTHIQIPPPHRFHKALITVQPVLNTFLCSIIIGCEVFSCAYLLQKKDTGVNAACYGAQSHIQSLDLGCPSSIPICGGMPDTSWAAT